MSTGQRIGQSAGKGRGFFKPWMKVALVTIIFAVLAMALGNVIWPPAEGGPEPALLQEAGVSIPRFFAAFFLIVIIYVGAFLFTYWISKDE